MSELQTVWVFMGDGATHPAGVFTSREKSWVTVSLDGHQSVSIRSAGSFVWATVQLPAP